MQRPFAEAFKTAVARSGKTQSAIATDSGLDATAISRYLRGGEPTASSLRRLCAIFPELKSWLDEQPA